MNFTPIVAKPFVIDDALGELLASRAADVVEATGEPRFGEMFLAQMRDTLEKTINVAEDGTTFVITGDIPAMWLRDSTTQMLPFMRLVDAHEGLREMVRGLLERQFRYILHDPYANAFNEEANGNAWHAGDIDPDPWLWERKFELDSLAFPVQLAHQYYQATGSLDFLTPDVFAAFRLIVDTLKLEQRHEENSRYRFVREMDLVTETLGRDGRGTPVGYTGMAWAGFRPSDDACTYHYNIPGNLLAALALDYIAEFAELSAASGAASGAASSSASGADGPVADENLARDARRLAEDIRAGVERFGVVEHPEFGRILAYEVDGLGNTLLMDDANMPSLLSLPMTSTVSADDALYRNTRAFVLSDSNPYFVRGSVAEGMGSPHTPAGYIWHIALAVQALTLPRDGLGQQERREEQLRIARVMAATDAGTGLMHEGFDANDPTQFTRAWFSWANSMFCELLLTLTEP